MFVERVTLIHAGLDQRHLLQRHLHRGRDQELAGGGTHAQAEPLSAAFRPSFSNGSKSLYRSAGRGVEIFPALVQGLEAPTQLIEGHRSSGKGRKVVLEDALEFALLCLASHCFDSSGTPWVPQGSL